MAGEPRCVCSRQSDVGTQKLRQQRVLVGALGRAAQQAIDRSEDFGILVVGRAAAGEHATPHLVAHAIFDLAHERLDTNGSSAKAVLL